MASIRRSFRLFRWSPCNRVGFRPIAEFRSRAWPSFLCDAVFLRAPGAAAAYLLRNLRQPRPTIMSFTCCRKSAMRKRRNCTSLHSNSTWYLAEALSDARREVPFDEPSARIFYVPDYFRTGGVIWHSGFHQGSDLRPYRFVHTKRNSRVDC